MTHPLTPREKVELKPCPFCGGDAVAGSNFDNDHYVMCGADCDKCGGMVGYMKTEMAAIENWNRRTALASGSGDHAELARECVRSLQSIEDRICETDPFRFTEGTIYAKSIRALEALLAENAALRGDLDVARTDLDHLEVHFRQRDREATEAERKLAEADRAARQIVELKIPPGNDPEQRLKLLSLLAKAQVLARTFLSKEAERG